MITATLKDNEGTVFLPPFEAFNGGPPSTLLARVRRDVIIIKNSREAFHRLTGLRLLKPLEEREPSPRPRNGNYHLSCGIAVVGARTRARARDSVFRAARDY